MKRKYFYLGIIFVFVLLSFLSCDLLFDNMPKKKYPETLKIEGYGALRYERTILDDVSLFWAAKSGSDIIALSEKSLIIIDALNNKIKKSINLRFDKDETVWHYIDVSIKFGKYMIVSNFYDDDTLNFNLNIIDSETLKVVRVNLTKQLFAKYRETISYIFEISESTRNTIVLKAKEETTEKTLYYETVDFLEWNKVEENEVVTNEVIDTSKAVDNGLTYYIDDRSSDYSDTYLCASRDDGLSWSESSLGTNYGRSLIVEGDTVWVACYGYHEQLFVFKSDMIGGGLHKLKWSYQ